MAEIFLVFRLVVPLGRLGRVLVGQSEGKPAENVLNKFFGNIAYEIHSRINEALVKFRRWER